MNDSCGSCFLETECFIVVAVVFRNVVDQNGITKIHQTTKSNSVPRKSLEMLCKFRGRKGL